MTSATLDQLIGTATAKSPTNYQRKSMPNPGKSPELKKLIGAKNADSGMSLVPAAIKSIPEPFRRLDESGLNLWNRAFSKPETWLAHTDLELLMLTCEKLDERDLLRIYVMDNMDAWHERAGLRSLEKQIEENLNILGFTPTARQKLGIQEVKAQSKLEEIIAKREARQ
jgi:hypothetical protein